MLKPNLQKFLCALTLVEWIFNSDKCQYVHEYTFKVIKKFSSANNSNDDNCQDEMD